MKWSISIITVLQGAHDVKNSTVLVYNRINKSGSTSMTSRISNERNNCHLIQIEAKIASIGGSNFLHCLPCCCFSCYCHGCHFFYCCCRSCWSSWSLSSHWRFSDDFKQWFSRRKVRHFFALLERIDQILDFTQNHAHLLILTNDFICRQCIIHSFS